ncbi:aspartyl-phosphate phosphatase Spo0E family protein [Thermohalobacter berrensis]|nr:aspartyl-phosphate phosphatase Spo0E family protein [Thermohalobacter berrensis]
MEGNLSLEELKVIIEEKRYQLNTLLKNNDTNREKALKLSVELDKLICKYYSAINKSN